MRQVQSPKQARERKEESVALGVILILIGSLLLLDSLGIIERITFAQLWPVALIGVGVLILYDRLRRSWRGR